MIPVELWGRLKSTLAPDLPALGVLEYRDGIGDHPVFHQLEVRIEQRVQRFGCRAEGRTFFGFPEEEETGQLTLWPK